MKVKLNNYILYVVDIVPCSNCRTCSNVGECSECNDGYRVVDGTCTGKNAQYFSSMWKPEVEPFYNFLEEIRKINIFKVLKSQHFDHFLLLQNGGIFKTV